MKNRLEILKERFVNATSEVDRERIDGEIRTLMNANPDSFANSMVGLAKATAERAEEILVRQKLDEVLPLISISYLARRYFNRSRQWFYQKMNGNMVNGKPARFTAEEIHTLNGALQDISKKIGSVIVEV